MQTREGKKPKTVLPSRVSSLSQCSAQFYNRQIDLPIPCVRRAGIVQRKGRGRRRFQDKERRSAGAGAICRRSKVYSRLKMRGSVIGRRHLHVVCLLKDARHLIGDQIISRGQGNMLGIRLDNVSGRIRDIRKHLNQRPSRQGILHIGKRCKHVVGNVSHGAGRPGFSRESGRARCPCGAGRSRRSRCARRSRRAHGSVISRSSRCSRGPGRSRRSRCARRSRRAHGSVISRSSRCSRGPRRTRRPCRPCRSCRACSRLSRYSRRTCWSCWPCRTHRPCRSCRTVNSGISRSTRCSRGPRRSRRTRRSCRTCSRLSRYSRRTRGSCWPCRTHRPCRPRRAADSGIPRSARCARRPCCARRPRRARRPHWPRRARRPRRAHRPGRPNIDRAATIRTQRAAVASPKPQILFGKHLAFQLSYPFLRHPIPRPVWAFLQCVLSPPFRSSLSWLSKTSVP